MSEPPLVSVWKESADDLDQVTLDVSGGYDVVKTGVQIEGTGAFHLVHASPTPQTILLNPAFDVGTNSKVFFESRLGWASSDQTARVEVSDDNGATWDVIWSRPGTGDSGQDSYERVTLLLDDYIGEVVRIRFNYHFAFGAYYPGDGVSLGWLLDDIQIGETYVIEPTLYSIGNPTDLEQQNLEFINRARASASAEAQRLLDTDDADVVAATNYFGVSAAILLDQFGELTETVPPLAFNERLISAARAHAQDMLNNEFQGHVSSSNPVPPNVVGDSSGDRAVRQGYQFAALAENVFSYAKSVWHLHAAFNIDWGTGSQGSIGGMQNPPGHRLSIHSATYREIGIGIVEGSNGSVGPMLVSQTFGVDQSGLYPLITGVAWEDLNGNGEYDPGEGIGGVTVTVQDGRFMAETTSSGGFAVPVQGDGVYVLHFDHPSGPNRTVEVTVTNAENVKVDYALHAIPIADFQGITPHPSDVSQLRIWVDTNGADPRLQYSDDLVEWHDMLDVDAIPAGGEAYYFDLVPGIESILFYRVLVDE